MPPSERLDDAAIVAGLQAVPGWRVEGNTIQRTYQTDGWRVSTLVAGAIAFICEAADHHADVTVTWPKVAVTLSTHSAGGITAKDLEVAAMIESHLTWRPPEGSFLDGPSKPLVR
ncbi:MAG: 4a-hydroxytetrahydrobiopterin dehydratase [Gemmatimonadales bacterium]